MPDALTTPDTSTPPLQLQIRQPLDTTDGRILLDVEFSLRPGGRLALLGPSGSGKTTLLRCLAGLQKPEQGRIEAFGELWLDTARQIDRPPRQRRAGLVFQDYALFPNMTAFGNVAFALPDGRRNRRQRARALLDSMGLLTLADQYPHQLSGGQQQRLALARSVAAEPRLLLLDEPLSALDRSLRHELQQTLLDLQRAHGMTLIIVTHDPAEALHLCDEALELQQGRIHRQGPPCELFRSGPADGSRLNLQARVIGATGVPQQYWVETGGQALKVEVSPGTRLQPGQSIRLGTGDWQLESA